MAELKEYQMRLDQFKRPLLVIKNNYDVQKVHDISGTYNTPAIISDALDEMFEVSTLADEYVWMFTLSSSHSITGVFEVSHGSVNRSMFPVREIIQRALLAGAVNIVIAHSHPSGNPEPSPEDIAVTRRLFDACKLVGLTVVDHIVIGCSSPVTYYSFCENNIMKEW